MTRLNIIQPDGTIVTVAEPKTPDEMTAALLAMKEVFGDRLMKPREPNIATPEVLRWHEQKEFVLQKPSSSGLHRLRGMLTTDMDACAVAKVFPAIDEEPTCFLIEHDWMAAFANATDLDDGEFPLPFDCTAFEFRVSDHHVIVWMTRDTSATFVEWGDTWILPSLCYQRDKNGFPLDMAKERLRLEKADWLDCSITLHLYLFNQIRAACIALDAAVATHELVRAPEKLNRKRLGKGAPPISDYHVIRLARRERATPLPVDLVDSEKRRSPRLHFARGHWRHYETHKTWIKWQLRGDPDLGFINKHYRL